MYYIFFRFFRKKRKLLNLPNGLILYGEYCMQVLIHVLNKGFENIQNKISNFTSTNTQLKERQLELEKHEILNDNDYPKLKSRYIIYFVFLILLVLSEAFLNFLTTLIVIPIEDDTSSFLKFVFQGARIAVAITATVAGMIAVHWVLEELLPHKKIETYIINNQNETGEKKKQFSLSRLILGLLIFTVIEFAIYHFGLKRAKDFEGNGLQAGDSAEALIILSMIIPVIAGAVWWDMQQYAHALSNRIKLEKIKLKIKRILDEKNKAIERLDTFFKIETTAFYTTFTRFKIDKEYFNMKQNPPIPNEDLSNHFCRDSDSFAEHAKNQTSKKIYKT